MVIFHGRDPQSLACVSFREQIWLAHGNFVASEGLVWRGLAFPKEARIILLTLTGFGDALRERFDHTNVSSSVSALQ